MERLKLIEDGNLPSVEGRLSQEDRAVYVRVITEEREIYFHLGKKVGGKYFFKCLNTLNPSIVDKYIFL